MTTDRVWLETNYSSVDSVIFCTYENAEYDFFCLLSFVTPLFNLMKEEVFIQIASHLLIIYMRLALQRNAYFYIHRNKITKNLYFSCLYLQLRNEIY